MGRQKKSNGASSRQKKTDGTSSGENLRFILGLILIVFALYMLVVFISYLLTGKADQDSLSMQKPVAEFAYENWGGKFGFRVGHYFIFHGFGLGAFFIPLIIGAFGLALVRVKYFRLWKNVHAFSSGNRAGLSHPGIFCRTVHIPGCRSGRRVWLFHS